MKLITLLFLTAYSLFFLTSCYKEKHFPSVPDYSQLFKSEDSRGINPDLYQEILASEIKFDHEVKHFLKRQISGTISELEKYYNITPADTGILNNDYFYYFKKYKDTSFRAIYRKNLSDKKDLLVLNPDFLLASYNSAAFDSIRISPDDKQIAFILKNVENKKLAICKISPELACKELPYLDIYDYQWIDSSKIVFTQLNNLRADKLAIYDFPSENLLYIYKSNDLKENILIKKNVTNQQIYIQIQNAGKNKLYSLLHNSNTPYLKLIANDHPENSGLPKKIIFKNFSVLPEYAGSEESIGIYSNTSNTKINEISNNNSGNFTVFPNQNYNSDSFIYSYSSPVSLRKIFRYDFRKNIAELVGSDKPDIQLGFNQLNYKSVALKVKSYDKTKIPVTLFYNNKKLPAPKKALIISYGAYGKILQEKYDPFLHFLMDNGFLLAFAHIRGGGEYGIKWHKSGIGKYKMNSIYDLASCAGMINGRYPGIKISLYSRSAGALNAAYTAVLKPELFTNIILENPFLDPFSYMNDQQDDLTELEKDEWQDVILPELKFSSSRQRHLPDFYIFASSKDRIIPLSQPLDWLIKLRKINSINSRVLLHLSNTAEHAGESLAYREIEEKSYLYNIIK